MRNCFAVGLIIAIPLAAVGDDKALVWPQFRGPNGSGVSESARPPVEFGPDKNQKWKVPVPSGLSSPIIAGDKLVITAFDNGKLCTIAFDRRDGREAWRAEAPAKQLEPFHKVEGSPATSTCATDGERIVAYFGSCGLLCYDLSGKELWKHELPPVSLPGDFGSGVSPVVADGLVILVRDQLRDAKIIALDMKTGRPRWETKRLSPVSYATPVIWDTAEGKQIAAAGHARMAGYDLRSGKELWTVNGLPSGCCASPVAAGSRLYFAGTASGGPEDQEFQFPSFDSMLKDLDADKDGALSRVEAEKAFEGFFDNQDANKDGKISRDEWDLIAGFFAEGKDNAFALKSGGMGDVTKTHLIWTQSKGLPYLASAIFYQGRYVMVRDGGVVTTLEADTGKSLSRIRITEGKYYASPVAANGFVYFTSLDGATTVVKMTGDALAIVAQNAKLDERTVATPAIADDILYIRTERHLYAFSEKP